MNTMQENIQKEERYGIRFPKGGSGVRFPSRVVMTQILTHTILAVKCKVTSQRYPLDE